MKADDKNSWVTRPLEIAEKIPYHLLLLADETIEAVNKYIFNSDIYIMEQENIAVATYVLSSLNKYEVEIKNIAVNKAYQGQGIGRLLLRDAADKAKEKGYREILIGTADTALKQLNLYQTSGFEFFSIKKDFFINNYPNPIFEGGIKPQDMVMLRKTIK